MQATSSTPRHSQVDLVSSLTKELNQLEVDPRVTKEIATVAKLCFDTTFGQDVKKLEQSVRVIASTISHLGYLLDSIKSALRNENTCRKRLGRDTSATRQLDLERLQMNFSECQKELRQDVYTIYQRAIGLLEEQIAKRRTYCSQHTEEDSQRKQYEEDLKGVPEKVKKMKEENNKTYYLQKDYQGRIAETEKFLLQAIAGRKTPQTQEASTTTWRNPVYWFTSKEAASSPST